MKFQTWDNLGQDSGQNYNITLIYNMIDLGQLRTRLGTKLQHHIDLQHDRLGTNFTQDLRQVL